MHGQSAGSFASTYHLVPSRVPLHRLALHCHLQVSPLARGLFHRVILQSGPGGFSPSYHHFTESRATKSVAHPSRHVYPSVDRYGLLAATELGCLSLTTHQTAACLRERPVLQLLAVDLLNQLMSHPT